MKTPSSRTVCLVLAGSIAVLLTGQPLQAANSTWDNNGTTNANWSTSSNWSPGVPGATAGTTNPDVATFADPLGLYGTFATPVLIDSPTQNIGGITFATGAGSYFLGTTGGNALQLTTGGTIQIAATLAASATETIDAPLILQGVGGSYTLANHSPNTTGTLHFGGAISAGATGNSVLNLISTNLNDNTISGNISNGAATSLAVSISGAGHWFLEGANTYSGDTTLNSGTMQLRGSSGDVLPDGVGKGNVVMHSTAILDLNGRNETINGLIGTSAGAPSIDNTTASAATLTFGANGGAVNFAGNFSNSGGGPLSLVKTGAAAGLLTSGTFSYTGTTTVQTGGSLAFTKSDPTMTSGVTVAGGARLSVINGAGNPLASLAILSLGAGGGATALGLDVGTITDTLVAAGAATAQGPVNFSIGAAPGLSGGSYPLLQAAGGGLTSGGASYAIQGSVVGGFTYSLTTSDTSVILNAAATAPGTFFWTGDQSGSWAAYNAGNTNWEDSASIDPAATPGPLDVVVFSTAINLPAGPAIGTTLDQPFAIDSLEFNGNNTSITAASVTIEPGTAGTLTIAPASSTDGIDVPDNGGTALITAPVVLGADQTWRVGNVGAVVPTLTVSGAMSGAGHLTKLGAGVATITGTNVQTGRTAIDAGVLAINSEAALGANPVSFTANHLTISGTLRSLAPLTIDDVNRGITMGASGGTFDTSGGEIIVDSVVTGGSVFKTGLNTLTLTNTLNTYATLTTVISGGTVRAGSNTALSSGEVVLNGSGTALELANGVNLANPIEIVDLNNAKTLRLFAGAVAGEFSGPVNVSESTTGNFRVNAPAGGTLTISGAISNTGSGTPGLFKNGAGTVVLSNPANTLTGPTTINTGILRHGASEVLSSATNVTVNATTAATPAILDLNGFNQTVGSLTFGGPLGLASSVNTVQTGVGTLTLGGNVTTIATGDPTTPALLQGHVAMPATRTFTIADGIGSDVDLLVSAGLSGPGGLTKNGPGEMELSGTNTYTGNTVVNDGALCVTGSLLTAGVLVNSGGQLSGTGAITGVITTNGGLLIGGIYGSGCSIGTQQIDGLTMHGNSRFALEIDTTLLAFDLTLIGGNLTLDPLDTVDLAIADLGGDELLTPGDKFTFITYDGSWNGEVFSVGGTPIADDIATFTLGANTYAIDYNDGGNSVSLVVVPEPATAASLLGGFALLTALPRHRRRRR